MNINISNEQLSAIVSKTIIDSLTEEKRQELLQNAVQKLIDDRPNDKDTYGRDKRNHLQIAFDNAVSLAIGQIAKEEVEKPEVKEQIRDLVIKGIEQAFLDMNKDQMIKNVASALRSSICKF